MEKARLGFGWMRLPQKSAETTDIDFDQVKQMVDEYMAAGFNYFDTSFVYHGGKSENAIKECLVKRKDRDSFVLTSKLPTFAITKEEQVEEIFSQQMENCGVEYFDYFLLHNLNAIRYDREVKECHMFEHMKQWKKEGKIKHIGFSFHDSADVLGRILNEHPEVEAVQIVVNYMDWDARFIQARECYETIRRNGCE
ncbi:MAG: aldo/keto reductase, partial [Selenomonas sp.]|nr:aldo/keto reductase [Selenomonas sp.]